MGGQSRAGSRDAGNRRSYALLALLVLATTAKFAAFALSFRHGYGWKVGLGLAVSVVQAGL